MMMTMLSEVAVIVMYMAGRGMVYRNLKSDLPLYNICGVGGMTKTYWRGGK